MLQNLIKKFKMKNNERLKSGNLKKKQNFKYIVLLFLLSLFVIPLVSAWNDNGSIIQYPDGCGTLSTENAIYNLISNVNASGSCYTITRNNVTLNCNNYDINFSNGGESRSGVYIDGFNDTIVYGCNIYEGNLSEEALDSTSKYAINIQKTSFNFNFTNNTIHIYGKNSRPMRIYDSFYGVVQGNYLYNNKSSTILMDNASYNTFLLNNVSSVNNTAFRLQVNSSHNNFTNNFAISSYIYGFDLDDSDFNILKDNYAISNFTQTGNAIRLMNSANNILNNNSCLSFNSSAIFISKGSENNTLIYNVANSTKGNGIIILNGDNNILYNNYGYSNNTGVGIFIWNSSYNNLTSNYGRSFLRNGIKLADQSNYSYLYNNTGITEYTTFPNYYSGINLFKSSHNNLTNNYGVSFDAVGINLEYALNNTLTSNLGEGDYAGIQLTLNSSYNLLINNIINSSNSTGFSVINSFNNSIFSNYSYSSYFVTNTLQSINYLYNMTNTLLHNGTNICNGSNNNINLNDGNINLTLNPGDFCYILNNYILEESTPKTNEPFNISKTTVSDIVTYSITSDILDSVTIPINLNLTTADCDNIGSLTITTKGSVPITYESADATSICNQLNDGYPVILAFSNDSNEIIIDYLYNPELELYCVPILDALSDIPTWFSIIIVITFMVVLILLTVLIIKVVRSENINIDFKGVDGLGLALSVITFLFIIGLMTFLYIILIGGLCA